MKSAVAGAVLVCAGLGLECEASTVYDRVSAFTAPPTQVFLTMPLQAEDVSIVNPSGESLAGVDLLCRLRSGSTLETFEGTLHLKLFTALPGSGSFPLLGTEFHGSSLPVSLQRGVSQLVSFDLPNVAAPGPEFWVGWYFQQSNGSVQVYNDVWVVQNVAAATVGATSASIAAANVNPISPAQYLNPGNNRGYAVRVRTVPGPGTAWVLALCGCVVGMRRREGRGESR